MQHQLYHKKTAFSLVEMLISLIIFSVIIGVFVPIISQKLLSSSIAINGFLTENGIIKDNVSIRPELDSQEACDLLGPNLLFLTAEQNGGKRACVTKANVGDTYADGPKINPTAGVTVVNAGESCGSSSDYSSKCCWLGNNIGTTSSNCNDTGNGDSTYSGCKRTVCNWNAAKSACANWEPDNSATLGKWRLPKKDELSAWSSNFSTIQIDKGKKGLELCDRRTGFGSVQCNRYNGACLGALDDYCFPTYVWSSDEYSSSNAYNHLLNLGGFNSRNDYKTNAFSARCLIDEDGYKEAYNNRVNKDDNSSTEPPSSDPSLIKSQADCDKLGSNLLFLTAEQNGGKRACVTKANVGDTYANGPEISPSAGVTVVNTNASCGSNTTSKCCWQGNNLGATSNSCGNSENGDSTYSGCRRTVCTFEAAKSACANWAPTTDTKGKWRLPTQNELSAWGNHLDQIQKNKGKNGLELCDSSSGLGSNSCSYNDHCPGAYYGDCEPSYIWSTDELDSWHSYFYHLNSGKLVAASFYKSRAFSARCIIDEDDIKGSGTVTPSEPATPTLPDDITSQEDCDKLGKNLLFLTASQNGGTAACVTKANVGDTYMNGPEISPSAGVSVVNSGTNCYQTKCCWLGNNIANTAYATKSCGATGNGDSTYSGCKRTVCNWVGAKAACEAWESVSGTKGLWRLPKDDELSAWSKNLNAIQFNKGQNGLQLCDTSNYYGSVKCYNDQECYYYEDSLPYTGFTCPHYLWSSTGETGVDKNSALVYYMQSGVFTGARHLNQLAFSARCVLDAKTYKGGSSSGGSSGGTSSSELPKTLASQEDCDKLGKNLLFLSAKQNGGTAACITKINAGDTYMNGPEISSNAGVTIVKAGATCGSSSNYSSKCCWLGNSASSSNSKEATSLSCSTGGNASSYSGCNRTVCTWGAAKTICENWEPVAGTKGKWRLPTKDEVTTWQNYRSEIQVGKGTKGMQLCDGYNNYNSTYCAGNTVCNGAYDSNCVPNRFWTSTSYSSNSDYMYHVALVKGNYNPNGYYKNAAASVRCMLDAKTYKNGSSSGGTSSGGSSGGTSSSGLPKTLTSQADCNKFGSNLLFLTASQNGGKAACVTKANVGDSYNNGPDLDKIKSEAGITVVQSRTKCGNANNYTTKCCWLGNNVGYTANSSSCTASGNGDSTYSGCKRTMCNWLAAKSACEAWESVSGTKGKWRLPTKNELSAWGNNLGAIQRNKGTSGLELCVNRKNYGSVVCVNMNYCNGAADDTDTNKYCYPYHLWALDTSGSNNAYYAQLPSSSMSSGTTKKTHAYSARCVLDEDAVKSL